MRSLINNNYIMNKMKLRPSNSPKKVTTTVTKQNVYQYKPYRTLKNY